MTLDLTSRFTGQSTSRVGAALPGPYIQATGTLLVDVEHVECVDVVEVVDVDVEAVEVPRPLPSRFPCFEIQKSLTTSDYSIVTSSGGKQPQLPPPTYQ